MDWFLCDNVLRHERVKAVHRSGYLVFLSNSFQILDPKYKNNFLEISLYKLALQNYQQIFLF